MKAELEEWRNNILYSSPLPPDGIPKGSGVSNPTLQKTSRLVDNRRIEYLEKIISSIDTILDKLDEDKLRLIELRYWQKSKKMNSVGIALELHVDESTVRRWVTAICYAIAIEIGIEIKC